MSSDLRCRECGSAMTPGTASGSFCAACLLDMALAVDSGEVAGARIGPYRLTRTLGEGGMGIVHLAEQEHPIQRRVALKVIKVGMDTREVIARFDAERQTLARMDHPHIARVLDAGVSADGRPYFAMDYVPGLPITEFCDQHRLSIDARLRLVQQVCGAVQHAHQRGIIHRDLKPSNVLVTLQDGQPVAKVIDFGVARATEQDVLVRTLLTEPGRMIGTPEYMSPEQASLGAVSIDTQTDIYSLGLILFELLVGTLPFQTATFRRAGYDEMRRIIREVEAPKPSTRIRTLDANAELARSRRTHVSALQRQLRGDLDWIVLKALEKDPARRYASASELSADIARHLRNDPVVAGPPSAVYRAQKFVRKYRMAVAGASLFVLLLVATAIVSTFLYLGAEAARREAETRRVQADQAREATTQQRGLADAASVEANRQRALAESQAGAADLARSEAERQRDEAERRAYTTDILAADLSLAAGEVREARRLLELAPVRLRGWEWGYLQHATDASVLTLLAPASSDTTRPVAAVDAVSFVQDRMMAIGTRSGSPLNRDALAEFSALGAMKASPRAASMHLDANTSILAMSGDGRRLLVSRWYGARPSARLLVTEAEPASGSTVELRVDNPTLTDQDRNRVFVIDARSGQRIATLTLASVGVWRGRHSDVSTIGLNPAIASRRNATIVDTSPRRAVVATVSYPVAVMGVLNDEGSRAAIWTWDNVMHVWDVATGQPIASLAGHSDFISRAVFTADSSRLVSSSYDATVRIWDLQSGRATTVLEAQPTPVTTLAVAQAGALIAAGFDDRGTIRLWRDAKPVSEVLRGHNAPTSSLSFDHDGGRLVSASEDRTVRVWDTTRMLELFTLHGHEGVVTAAAFSPDDRVIASSSLDGTIRLWDASAPLAAVAETRRPVRGVAFVDNGTAIVSGHNDDIVRIWDLRSGTVARQATLPGEVASLAVSADGSRIVVGLINQATRNRPQPNVSALILDTRTLRTVARLAGQQGIVGSVAISGNGARAATAAPSGVWVWDTDAAHELHHWSGEGEPRSISLSGDGSLIAAGFGSLPTGGGLLVRPAGGAGRSPTMTTKMASPASAVAFTSDGSRVVSGGDDGVVRIWDVRSGRQLAMLSGHDAAVQAVTISRDDRRIASASADRTLRLWATDTHELLLTLRLTNTVQCLSFSADGERLAAGILGGAIRVWVLTPPPAVSLFPIPVRRARSRDGL